MRTLKEILHSYLELESLNLKSEVEETTFSDLKRCNLIFALYSFFEEQDLKKAKQYFYNCGLLDAYRIKTFNNRLFVYDLHSIGYAMLSDNLSFIKNDYAHLTFTDFYLDKITEERIDRTMEDHVLEGDDGCIFVHTVQQFLLGNNALIERNLEIMQRIYFGANNQNSSMQYDINFFKALYDRDLLKCEAILKEMVSPKIHQRRNDDALLKKYISMPALGYAKLAWLLDMKVEVKSKLIPKELLPIEPLDNYEITYDFLK